MINFNKKNSVEDNMKFSEEDFTQIENYLEEKMKSVKEKDLTKIEKDNLIEGEECIDFDVYFLLALNQLIDYNSVDEDFDISSVDIYTQRIIGDIWSENIKMYDSKKISKKEYNITQNYIKLIINSIL